VNSTFTNEIVLWKQYFSNQKKILAHTNHNLYHTKLKFHRNKTSVTVLSVEEYIKLHKIGYLKNTPPSLYFRHSGSTKPWFPTILFFFLLIISIYSYILLKHSFYYFPLFISFRFFVTFCIHSVCSTQSRILFPVFPVSFVSLLDT